jgi:hypothetical protein
VRVWADKPFHPSYRLFMISDSTTWLRFLGARFAPEFCVKRTSLWEHKGAGKAGCPPHPWPPCMKKHGEGTTGVGLRTARVHRIPLPTFVTIAKRPSLSRRDSDKGSQFPFFVKRNCGPPCAIVLSGLERFTKLDFCARDFGSRKVGEGRADRIKTRSTGESASKWRSNRGRAHAPMFSLTCDHMVTY